ncbi:hypothetical protein [Streptomyces litchfieldiae]|uniref:Uncharacterized protein n=1 Tax=Streptomyces litchfieldiae TaxID=3075543 RepID=A0ABU2MXZ0_9ACTN|nr:hypothetical protein [Streptomyces sp. DSM 44938]MDT0346390.1 hypothetical protein [Streptomyces sp. DSM 44938]
MDRLRIDAAPPVTAPVFRPGRLHLPVTTPDALGGDAVGVSEEHGRSIMNSLPRAGAVFAVSGHWWWIVPSESQVGLNWPTTARYWPGACLPGPLAASAAVGRTGRSVARLVHWPEDAAPYTHPLLLFIAVCRLAGVSPVSSVGTGVSPG